MQPTHSLLPVWPSLEVPLRTAPSLQRPRGRLCSRARSSPGRCALWPPRSAPVAAVLCGLLAPLLWPLCSVASLLSCGRCALWPPAWPPLRPHSWLWLSAPVLPLPRRLGAPVPSQRCCLRPGVHPTDWPRSRQAARGAGTAVEGPVLATTAQSPACWLDSVFHSSA